MPFMFRDRLGLYIIGQSFWDSIHFTQINGSQKFYDSASVLNFLGSLIYPLLRGSREV